MPDGEGAVVLHGEEQVAAVGADARMTDGGRNAGCRELLAACRQLRPDDLWAENGVYLRTQLARLFIEGNAAETVLQLLELLGQLHMRRPAEIDVAAVGREGGEGLESQTVGERSLVVDLKAFARGGVEGRDDDIGREYHVASRRTEAEIDAARHHLGCLQGEFSQHSVLVEHGSAALSAYIHHGQLRVLMAESMAVHAAVAHLLIVADNALVEVLNAPLAQGEVVEYLVVGLNEAVGKTGV